MTMEPKTITVPGIPGPLREQSLDEFLSVLTPDHLARKQLDEIRNQALKSVELSTQLMQANEKVIELQNRLLHPPAPAVAYPTQPAVNVTLTDPPPPHTIVGLEPFPNPPATDPRSGPFPKVECPHCKKLVSSAPGPWSIHQRNNHPDNQAPRPKV